MPLSPITRQAEGTDYHYRPGDFGLIPRPQQHIQTNIEKMHELSQTSRLGSLKKVLTRSISTQTISTPKVRGLIEIHVIVLGMFSFFLLD